MQSQGSREEWHIDGVFGQEVWTRQDGRFVKACLDENCLDLDSADTDLDLLRIRRTSACSCKGPWPSTFLYCPNCGASLAGPAPLPPDELWCAPYGTAEGLSSFKLGKAPDPASRADMLLPDHTTLSFVVAGYPSRLFALDHSKGHLYRWIDGPENQPEGGRWAQHLRIDLGPGLPRWSWGAAAFRSGIALPGGGGPVWVSLRPDKQSAAVLSDDSQVEACLGGIALLGNMAIAPIRHGGKLAIAVWTEDGSHWETREVVGAPSSEAIFAVPVTHKDDAHWVGEDGRLFISRTASGLRAEFLPWTDGFSPVTGVRPILTADGNFYQMGRVGTDVVKWEMLRPSSTPASIFEARGLALSCGKSIFQNGKRYALPWEKSEPLTEYIFDDDEFILPLIGLDENRYVLAFCPQRTTLKNFVDTSPENIQSKRSCKVVYSGGNRMKTELGKLVSARYPWDISTFIFRNHLFIYSACDNVGWHWKLR